MKHCCSRILIIVFTALATLSVFAQNKVDAHVEQLSKASTASDIRKVLKAAEKEGLTKGELLDLRYAAYLHTLKHVSDRTLERNQRNLLAHLLREFEEELPKQVERYLSEVEKATPDSREISRVSVRLAQLLSAIPIDGAAARRGKLVEQRRELVLELYRKALRVEAKADPASVESLALTVLLADEYLASVEIENALPLYKEALAGIELKEGKHSKARVRALFNLAQITDIAGDVETTETLKKELSALGVTYQQTLSLNARTDGRAEGIRGRSGRVLLEIAYEYVSPANPPDEARPIVARSRPPTGRNLSRVRPEVNVVSSLGSSAHPAIVTVDAEGNVTNVEVVSPESPEEKIVSMVKKWKFRPLVYEGKRSSMKGLVYCWIFGKDFP